MRLIDADSLIDWLTIPTGFRTNCEDCICYEHSGECISCIVSDAIKNEPTINPAVHGWWILNCISGEDPYQCSVCGNTVSVHGYKYCPNCGAIMDGHYE